ncbi:hypothetical protein HK105_202472 [Polyrhizophydium stewartii]|uniref:Uncharacterized protein n=1 Tax=Polyrhizophydium stewartii TaxID=2732419 RepID=A0ABR4NEV2_9FUNG
MHLGIFALALAAASSAAATHLSQPGVDLAQPDASLAGSDSLGGDLSQGVLTSESTCTISDYAKAISRLQSVISKQLGTIEQLLGSQSPIGLDQWRQLQSLSQGISADASLVGGPDCILLAGTGGRQLGAGSGSQQARNNADARQKPGGMDSAYFDPAWPAFQNTVRMLAPLIAEQRFAISQCMSSTQDRDAVKAYLRRLRDITHRAQSACLALACHANSAFGQQQLGWSSQQQQQLASCPTNMMSSPAGAGAGAFAGAFGSDLFGSLFGQGQLQNAGAGPMQGMQAGSA